MVNNPMMQVLQLMRNGGNPMAMLNQMTGNNPMVSTLMKSMQGDRKSTRLNSSHRT